MLSTPSRPQRGQEAFGGPSNSLHDARPPACTTHTHAMVCLYARRSGGPATQVQLGAAGVGTARLAAAAPGTLLPSPEFRDTRLLSQQELAQPYR